ncbi:hypothetical protein PoB_003864900 [Plakobranchus ocellatus]|uniref:Uncharacterized protein n=1 Tax=Plakobranchus ocellatus TaxID=259542 RepID=A0AAV4B0E4_9GAST|nr:hypothetical protein PoB_003864900 [Plakobranchus ocellatus]
MKVEEFPLKFIKFCQDHQQSTNLSQMVKMELKRYEEETSKTGSRRNRAENPLNEIGCHSADNRNDLRTQRNIRDPSREPDNSQETSNNSSSFFIKSSDLSDLSSKGRPALKEHTIEHLKEYDLTQPQTACVEQPAQQLNVQSAHTQQLEACVEPCKQQLGVQGAHMVPCAEPSKQHLGVQVAHILPYGIDEQNRTITGQHTFKMAFSKFSGIQCEDDLQRVQGEDERDGRGNNSDKTQKPDLESDCKGSDLFEQTYKKLPYENEDPVPEKERVTYFNLTPCDVLGMSPNLSSSGETKTMNSTEGLSVSAVNTEMVSNEDMTSQSQHSLNISSADSGNALEVKNMSSTESDSCPDHFSDSSLGEQSEESIDEIQTQLEPMGDEENVVNHGVVRTFIMALSTTFRRVINYVFPLFRWPEGQEL